jgi:hypothetical protein
MPGGEARDRSEMSDGLGLRRRPPSAAAPLAGLLLLALAAPSAGFLLQPQGSVLPTRAARWTAPRCTAPGRAVWAPRAAMGEESSSATLTLAERKKSMMSSRKQRDVEVRCFAAPCLPNAPLPAFRRPPSRELAPLTPYTMHPIPYTPHPTPHILNHRPQTLDRKPCVSQAGARVFRR